MVEARRRDSKQQAIAQAGNAQYQCDVVEPGEIAADDEHRLKGDDEDGAKVADPPGAEQEPRGNQFDQVIEQDTCPVKQLRSLMQVPADRIGDGLSFILVEQAGQIHPTGVAAEFDETGSEHDTEQDPAQQQQDPGIRRAVFQAPSALDGWTQEHRQEAGLQQQGLPAVGVE